MKQTNFSHTTTTTTTITTTTNESQNFHNITKQDSLKRETHRRLLRIDLALLRSAVGRERGKFCARMRRVKHGFKQLPQTTTRQPSLFTLSAEPLAKVLQSPPQLVDGHPALTRRVKAKQCLHQFRCERRAGRHARQYARTRTQQTNRVSG